MFYDIISIALSGYFSYRASTYLLNRDKKKLEKSVSETVKELANSLLSDKGWKYQLAHKGADGVYYSDRFQNLSLDSAFTLTDSFVTNVSYRYGFILKPFFHAFNEEEHKLIQEATKKLALMVLRDARLDLLEKEITGLN